ncbi:hypothetical protein HPB51_006245 [Rhipicephalus microplus]|uniref:Tc1-like transposase DDE domain-containing protein n=1 Tax=Rhipicephalus microplus TaxID=6941 RepID=A0A9J6DLC9_RHIMP|nr:hypothetical protein HPB51_006245 [Rhipicephalus microplus]
MLSTERSVTGCTYSNKTAAASTWPNQQYACWNSWLGVMLLEWPPQGADMNICENVWGAVKKALLRQPSKRGSEDALWAALKEEWERLRASDLVTRLFDSLPRRIGAVVAAAGEFTK